MFKTILKQILEIAEKEPLNFTISIGEREIEAKGLQGQDLTNWLISNTKSVKDIQNILELLQSPTHEPTEDVKEYAEKQEIIKKKQSKKQLK